MFTKKLIATVFLATSSIISLGTLPAFSDSLMTWKKTPNVAQYKEADWTVKSDRGIQYSGKYGKTMNFSSVEQAKRHATKLKNVTFFFHCRNGVFLETLGEAGRFKANDTVFFAGKAWYGSAPQCDAYEKIAPPYVKISGTFRDCPKTDENDILSYTASLETARFWAANVGAIIFGYNDSSKLVHIYNNNKQNCFRKSDSGVEFYALASSEIAKAD